MTIPILNSLYNISFIAPFNWVDYLLIASIVVLLFFSGFMSSSEVAFFSLSPSDIFSIKESSSLKDRKLLRLLSNSEQLLATILIGNNIVNVGLVVLASFTISSNIDFSEAPVWGFILQTIVLTFLLLLFGEIIPKVYAQSNPLKFIRNVATPINVVFTLLSPLSKALMKTGRLSLWHNNKGGNKGSGYEISVDDLSKAVELTTHEQNTDTDMINEIIRFYNKTADEIMIPRIDMVDIDYNWGFRKMLSFAVESGYSRLPVYEGSEDCIRGILYIKDLIPHMHKDDNFAWQSLIRPAYFVPENKKIDNLLEELRHEKVHIAIVVDEFGGTCGIITLEDILEEIVGEIVDEYDDELVPFIKVADNVYLFEGRTTLTDLSRALNLNEELFEPLLSNVDTLGGLFLEIKKEIPQLNDTVTYKNLTLEVTGMDRFRILQIKLTIHPEEQSAQ